MTTEPAPAEAAVLTVAEVAAYLKISPTTVWRHCMRGTLPAFRVGRQWRVERHDLVVWISALKAQASSRSAETEA
jgi:excisionase family DNA binding protein